MDIKGKKINFLGDSITEGFGASDMKKTSFVPLIAANTGAVCRNYGVGGTTIAPIKTEVQDENWLLDFCKRAPQMEKDADYVIIFGGTNDYGHGDAPLGKDSDTSTDTFFGSLYTLYSYVAENFPQAKIGVITPLHRTNELNRVKRGDSEVNLYDYVKAIRSMAEYFSFPVLDLFAQSGIQPGVPAINKMYMPDGLHPNDNGYKILEKKITAFIESL